MECTLDGVTLRINQQWISCGREPNPKDQIPIAFIYLVSSIQNKVGEGFLKIISLDLADFVTTKIISTSKDAFKA